MEDMLLTGDLDSGQKQSARDALDFPVIFDTHEVKMMQSRQPFPPAVEVNPRIQMKG